MSAVFLFGAGASYGSDVTGTPPMGAGIFDALRAFDPAGWGTIAGNIAGTFRRDFEEGMKRVDGRALPPLQRAMAAYFFEFAPLLSNLYLELAQRIARSAAWSGAVCTLNYERLLELSMCRAGLQPFVGNSPTGKRGFELCLPHGCCHIFCDSALGRADSVVFHAYTVKTDGPVSVIIDPQQHRARLLQDAFPPVMSYFEAQKRTTAGNSFIEGQRARWRDLAARATTIIAVGARVRAHDDHIWAPVAASNARIVFCAGAVAGAEYEAWARTARTGRGDRVLPGYFRDEYNNLCLEAGL